MLLNNIIAYHVRKIFSNFLLTICYRSDVNSFIRSIISPIVILVNSILFNLMYALFTFETFFRSKDGEIYPTKLKNNCCKLLKSQQLPQTLEQKSLTNLCAQKSMNCKLNFNINIISLSYKMLGNLNSKKCFTFSTQNQSSITNSQTSLPSCLLERGTFSPLLITQQEIRH